MAPSRLRKPGVGLGYTFTGEDSPMATLLLSVMGAFAGFERALILERQREGIAAAKARGVCTGRAPALTPGAGRPAARARRRRRAQGRVGHGVRHQPRDRVQLSAGRTTGPRLGRCF